METSIMWMDVDGMETSIMWMDVDGMETSIMWMDVDGMETSIMWMDVDGMANVFAYYWLKEKKWGVRCPGLMSGKGSLGGGGG